MDDGRPIGIKRGPQGEDMAKYALGRESDPLGTITPSEDTSIGVNMRGYEAELTLGA